MVFLRICVLGRLLVEREGVDITARLPHRAQELLCYVLLHHQTPHLRERLCETLWGETTQGDPRKLLRQTLWQLKSAITPQADSAAPINVEGELVHANLCEGICFDAAQFEQALGYARQTNADPASDDYASALRRAIDSYAGELLPNWYSDWCLLERERLQNLYISALDRMAACCELRKAYDEGVHCIEAVLRIDRVNENAWRQNMRLLYLRGDRASALRQYERCAEILRQELNVLPSRQTVALRDQIVDGNLDVAGGTPAGFATSGMAPQGLADLVQNLQRLHATLVETEREFRGNLNALMQFLNDRR